MHMVVLTLNVRTNRVFRDPAAWYHLVVRIDTTQASSSDRVKYMLMELKKKVLQTYTDATQNDANNVINETGSNNIYR